MMPALLALPADRLLPVLALALVAGWLAAVLLREVAQRFGPPLIRPGLKLWRAGWKRPRAVLERHAPRFTAFLERRFDPGRGDGLIVTLIVIAAVYAASLGAGLVEELLEVKQLEAFDKAVFAVTGRWDTPMVVAVFRWITILGNFQTLLAVVVVATGFLLSHGPRSFLLPTWVVILGSQLTTWGGKFALNRARPEFIFDVTASSPSFPSGHSANSLAVYGIIAYVIARDLGPARALHVYYWTLAAVLLIASSRVMLHVHYPSDVLAGLLVGVFWLLLGIAIAERRRGRSLLADRLD
jgi:membrane-associated phospholipid phosphatase